MNLDGWTWEEATLRANAGIEFNFPVIGGDWRARRLVVAADEAAGPSNTPFDQLKKQRDDRLDEIAQLFERARAYAKAGPDKTKDWVLDALVPVVERRLPLVVNVVAGAGHPRRGGVRRSRQGEHRHQRRRRSRLGRRAS